MTTETYNLVFSGELARGADLAEAKRNIQGLFKVSAAQVDSLFSGKPIVLKKGLDFDTASKYRVAIKKAGCLVDVQAQAAAAPEKPVQKASFEARDPAPVSEPAAPAAEPKVEKPQESVSPVKSEPAPARAVASPASNRNEGSHFSYQDEIDAPNFDVAPSGSDLIQDSEREIVATAAVNVPSYSIRDAGADLLDEGEKSHVPERHVDTTGMDLAPAGADVLKPEERQSVAPRQVDTSALSLAEPGATLAEKKEEIPLPEPDISGLRLE